MPEDTEERKEGRPWTIHRRYDNFEDADEERKRLLRKRKNRPQAKVRRWASGQFGVLVREP